MLYAVLLTALLSPWAPPALITALQAANVPCVVGGRVCGGRYGALWGAWGGGRRMWGLMGGCGALWVECGVLWGGCGVLWGTTGGYGGDVGCYRGLWGVWGGCVVL